jgi:predicted secreted Zn-dependent protease
MRVSITALILVSAASAFYCAPAVAKPSVTTNYVYYKVSGESAVDIYSSMLSRGPHVNGAKAYAATLAESSQSGKLEQKGSCRVRDYKFAMKFTIRLPRIADHDGLTPKVAARWQQFTQFLKKHEETHRAIWVDCARDIENQINSLRAKSCAEIDRRAQQIVDRVQKACNRKHTAFDNAEQKRLSKHPFVKMVIARVQQTAMAVSKRKKKRGLSTNFN